MYCKNCRERIDNDATFCPHCGEATGVTPSKKSKKRSPKKPIFKKWWFWVLIVVLIVLIIPKGSDPEVDTQTPITDPIVQMTDSAAPDLNTLPAAAPEAEPVNEDDDLTAGQKNALRSAKNYLDFSAFSHDGLISQLEFEQYSTEDATYAADNCGADWNEQAFRSAKSYLEFSAFSYSGLIKQLEFEKFTTEQATYGADNCGADWNEQAVKSAKNYLDMSGFSRDGLIDQLVFEGFTQEQAEHGVEQNGL